MDRPRRTVRQPIKPPQTVAPEPIARPTKRRLPTPDPADYLKTLLESSKSDLVSLDMNDIINANTWGMLSEDGRARLRSLLPPTVFSDYRETLGEDHPATKDTEPKAGSCSKGEDANATLTELNLSVFTDPHFLAAARTFQDHLYLGWFTDAHAEKVRQFQEGVMKGTMSAPWKDEIWERDNVALVAVEPDIEAVSSARAGGASQVKLFTLAKKGIIRVGDVIAYKRAFATSEVVEKDVIVQSVHPKTYALTVLTQPGAVKYLPSHLLTEPPEEPSAPTLSMTITSPSMLETGLLDTDGRMEKARRPNGNAWKSFTVWRWRGGGNWRAEDDRGGRENHGTLFYLRGSYYHEM
ncbi:hypothetical protein M413DRAFT_423424 [Hebeloma cylindrosporum]|uniref:ASX DEUBAD domain-containing protein n=1 Tax=Hebeloma cylindrosporum TaxID=76867 RepID=A0A0C2XI38_HEBCY|nr:hypothetical protein M413DRAFT_423424 [Hebeloma cylindrosporum h7]